MVMNIPRMRHHALITFTLFLTILGGAGCPMERGFIFFPDRTIFETPADIGLVFEDLYLLTPDGVKINAWFVPYPESRVTLLWFHGNAGNLSNRVDQLRHFHREVKLNVMMIDYREYGRSEGQVTEEGTYQDALASYDYLLTRPELEPAKIIVFGQSLGSAIAVELAVQRQVHGLILEAPFTSVPAMARATMPWLPIGSLFSTKYDTLSKIGGVEAPLLILHGDRDEIVPYSQGRRVFEAAREPKTFYTIPGAGHNDTYGVGGRAYFEAIARFIEDLPKRAGLHPAERGE